MTEKTQQFNSYSDPGHGWCKVNVDTLVQLGIADQISRYSYQRQSANGTMFAYLEEDRDMSLFYDALEKIGIKPVFKHHTSDKSSKIRGYDRYVPPVVEQKENVTASRPKFS